MTDEELAKVLLHLSRAHDAITYSPARYVPILKAAAERLDPGITTRQAPFKHNVRVGQMYTNPKDSYHNRVFREVIEVGETHAVVVGFRRSHVRLDRFQKFLLVKDVPE
jgi:hypothetical protein